MFSISALHRIQVKFDVFNCMTFLWIGTLDRDDYSSVTSPHPVVTDRHIYLTYEELHLKAIHLADQLHQLEIQGEESVSIIVQHGVADVVVQ